MLSLVKATKHDKRFIAQAMVEASGGICDYLLKDKLAKLSPEQLLSFEVARSQSPFSYNNCLLLKQGDKPVGLICAYPAEDFVKQLKSMNLSEKTDAIETFYRVQFPKNCLYIDTVFISPEFRGQGLAKCLLLAVKSFLSAADYHQLALYVWEDNLRAIALYQSFGFTVAEQRRSLFKQFPIQQQRLLMTSPVVRYLPTLETHLSTNVLLRGVRREELFISGD
jgi:ribosomal protein S18 acetylase RimI-like enzyme